MANKYVTLAKNTGWTLLGNSGSKLLSFLLLPLYTRWLGTAGFGLSDLITTYATLLLSFSTLCLADSIFVFTKGCDRDTIRRNFSSSIVLTFFLLVVWLTVFFVIDCICSYLGVRNSFSNNIWYIFLMIVSTFIQQYFHNLILGFGYVKLFSSTGIVLTLTTFVFSYLLIPLYGVRGYILSIICANLVTVSYTIFFSKAFRYFSLQSFDTASIKQILKYSIPLIPNSIVWWLVSALNRPVMEHYLTYDDIGIYSLANRFPSVVTMLFGIFAMSWNISIFEEFQKDGFEKFYKDVFKIIFICISFCSLFIIVCSDAIVSIFAPAEFKDAGDYMKVMIIATVFSCISSFCGGVFSVVRQSKYYFYSSVFGALTAIALNFILIPLYGLWGTVGSVFISFAVIAISRYKYSKQYVHISLSKSCMLYIFVLLLASILTIVFKDFWINLLIGLLLCALLIFLERNMIHKLFGLFSQKVLKF